jgi:hypothetical protein
MRFIDVDEIPLLRSKVRAASSICFLLSSFSRFLRSFNPTLPSLSCDESPYHKPLSRINNRRYRSSICFRNHYNQLKFFPDSYHYLNCLARINALFINSRQVVEADIIGNQQSPINFPLFHPRETPFVFLMRV